jgi:glycosyltransferase involved in cell wall biosynthesis
MKIAIGIPNYNRLEDITRLSRSLKYVKQINVCEINIHDDNSTQYDKKVLEELFAEFANVNIYENKENLGSDLNIYHTCKHFIDSENDYLFLCDSDLILSPKCLEFIEANIADTEGVMSLFNANKHPSKGEISEKFIAKHSVGSAGVVFSKELLKDIILNVPQENVNMWDWSFCRYLNSKHVQIYVSRQSYVQHMGFNGENANFLLYDYGKNYEPQTEFEKKELEQLYQSFFQAATGVPDEFILRTLLRKVLRKNIRKLIAKIFGEKVLFNLLSKRKNKLKYRKNLEKEFSNNEVI